VSLIGPNDVPYPYAIDNQKQVYLLLIKESYVWDENMKTKNKHYYVYQNDPYHILWTANLNLKTYIMQTTEIHNKP
jgi:hypothetical protein